VLVLNTITAFAYTFTYVYVISNGGPGNSTYTTDFYMYESGFTNAALGYAAAMAVILILVIAIIGSIQIRVVTKGQV
jgi:ABC-type sugar transport system permease subunit